MLLLIDLAAGGERATNADAFCFARIIIIDSSSKAFVMLIFQRTQLDLA
jgi:hypothetical protein